jgi:hypothetical protein
MLYDMAETQQSDEQNHREVKVIIKMEIYPRRI